MGFYSGRPAWAVGRASGKARRAVWSNNRLPHLCQNATNAHQRPQALPPHKLIVYSALYPTRA